jgi:hypothetical protein
MSAFPVATVTAAAAGESCRHVAQITHQLHHISQTAACGAHWPVYHLICQTATVELQLIHISHRTFHIHFHRLSHGLDTHLLRSSRIHASDCAASCTLKHSSCCSSCLKGPSPRCCVVAPSSSLTAVATGELAAARERQLSRCSAAARFARAAGELPGQTSGTAARRLECCGDWCCIGLLGVLILLLEVNSADCSSLRVVGQ